MKTGFAFPILLLAVVVVHPAAGASDDTRLTRYPDPEWPETRDLARGQTSPEAMTAYAAWLKENGGLYWASVVIKQGYLVYAGRGPRCQVFQKNDCGSILKPLQATVLGAALQQGKLKSIDENAFDYWPDHFATPYANDRVISFRQFAQYRDRWNEPEPPGSYYYNNSSATAAGYCIAGLFGEVRGPRPTHGIAGVARREVMERIGAQWDLWQWDEDFPTKPQDDGPRMEFDSGAYELAKLGYLWLRQGRWKNTRIFSEAFYREAVTDWSPDTNDPRAKFRGHYGYWWFVNSRREKLPSLPEDAFYAYGWGEHRRATLLLIVPRFDLVAVLSMERISADGKWDVIQNAQSATNDGPRRWSEQLARLHLAAARP